MVTKRERLKETSCIEFAGFKDVQGYGVVSMKNIRIKAHRMAFKLANPMIALTPKKDICHHCDNPSCINPNHLFVGTHGDNNKDRARKGRSAKGMKHGNAKLTDKDVRKIRNFINDGIKVTHIAKKFRVSKGSICFIRDNIYWKHLE